MTIRDDFHVHDFAPVENGVFFGQDKRIFFHSWHNFLRRGVWPQMRHYRIVYAIYNTLQDHMEYDEKKLGRQIASSPSPLKAFWEEIEPFLNNSEENIYGGRTF